MVYIAKWKVVMILVLCALGFIFASPNLLERSVAESIPDWLPHKQISLGLDLQGGAHLLLEAKIGEAMKESLQNLTHGVRVALRKEKIGYTGIGPIRNGVGVTIRKAAKKEE